MDRRANGTREATDALTLGWEVGVEALKPPAPSPLNSLSACRR
jgi:hypothetical protein